MNNAEQQEEKENVFEFVQEFLRHPPVIIWGSGATIPYGLPSMNDLKEILRPEFPDFDESSNLETQLENVDGAQADKIKKLIKNEVFEKDIMCLKKFIEKPSCFEAITKMINKFYTAHPSKIDIVTTNYDRVLEYALSQKGYNYTDGFTGKPLSKFCKNSFQEKKIINLIKVHGSLNWVTGGSDCFFLPCNADITQLDPVMILPSKSKYRAAYEEPYRTLIIKSDEVIEEAKSFFVVGFGFNDDHLTPKINNRIKEGIPLVIITKNATEACRNKLSDSSKYCLFEKGETGTKATFKKKSEPQEIQMDNHYWKLDQFMGILGP